MALFDGIKNAISKIGNGIKSAVKVVAKTVSGAVQGYATGGIVGAVMGGVSSAVTSIKEEKENIKQAVNAVKNVVEEVKAPKTEVAGAPAQNVKAVKETTPLKSITALANSPAVVNAKNVATAVSSGNGNVKKNKFFTFANYDKITQNFMRVEK